MLRPIPASPSQPSPFPRDPCGIWDRPSSPSWSGDSGKELGSAAPCVPKGPGAGEKPLEHPWDEVDQREKSRGLQACPWNRAPGAASVSIPVPLSQFPALGIEPWEGAENNGVSRVLGEGEKMERKKGEGRGEKRKKGGKKKGKRMEKKKGK